MRQILKIAILLALFSASFFIFSKSVSALCTLPGTGCSPPYQPPYNPPGTWPSCNSCSGGTGYCAFSSLLGGYLCYSGSRVNCSCTDSDGNNGVCNDLGACAVTPPPPPPPPPPSCSSRGEGCNTALGEDDCCSGLNCNSTSRYCYNNDRNLPGGTLCYGNTECTSGVCSFITATNPLGVCTTPATPTPPPGGTPTPPPGGGTPILTPGPVGPVITITNPLRYNDLTGLLNAVISFIFWIGMAIAPIMFIIAGFIYVTSAGSPQKLMTARNIMLYTAIGLAVLLLAKGLVVVLQSIIGVR